jgi:hypothetical protein
MQGRNTRIIAVTAYILDGMAIVQMVKTAGACTFGELASNYFNTITAPLEKKQLQSHRCCI